MNQIPILPKEAYYKQEYFDLEQELIFSKTWQFAGFEEDVSEVGDHITVKAGYINIIVIRKENGDLAAFHNMCRHRGAQLLRTAGRKKNMLTCPYHDWTYKIDGSCASIPDQKSQFPTVDKKDKSLLSANIGMWKGMIFVHPDSGSESLMDWLGELPALSGPHQVERLTEFEDTLSEHDIDANWKIVAENFMDVYHLSHLHSSTLKMYDHKEQKSGFTGPHFHFYEPLETDYKRNYHNRTPYPPIDHIPEDKIGAYTPLIFPNLGLAEDESSWSIFHIIPISPEKTKVIIRSKTMPVSSMAYYQQEVKSNAWWKKNMSAKYGEWDENDPMASGDLMAEDKYACEQLQKSMRSPFLKVEHTAKDLEAAVRQYQQIIADYLKLK